MHLLLHRNTYAVDQQLLQSVRFIFFLAGCAEGIDAWSMKVLCEEATTDRFLPRLTEEERNAKFERWNMAVERSLGWIKDGESGTSGNKDNPSREVVSDATTRLYASVPAALFIVSAIIMFKVAAAESAK